VAILPDHVKQQLRERLKERLSGPVQLKLYTRPGTGRLILPSGMGCPTCDDARELAEAFQEAAPELIDLEVVSVLRRQLSAGGLDARRAQLALDDLRELPMQRAPHRPLLTRCWELRDNLTPYDAAYFALAEALESLFLTADAHLANSPGVTCRIELLRP